MNSTHTYAHLQTHMYTIQKHTGSHMYMYTHTHTHTHTWVRTHAHTAHSIHTHYIVYEVHRDMCLLLVCSFCSLKTWHNMKEQKVCIHISKQYVHTLYHVHVHTVCVRVPQSQIQFNIVPTCTCTVYYLLMQLYACIPVHTCIQYVHVYLLLYTYAKCI